MKYQNKKNADMIIELGEKDNAGWTYDCVFHIAGEFAHYDCITVEDLAKDWKPLKETEAGNE